MSKFKDIAKGGWHPEKGKDGKSRSLRGDNKGINTVAGWMGKGKDSHSNDEARDHVSRPLATLKDPYAFGPPPKNVSYHGGAALPNQITPDTRGLGAPLTREEIEARRMAEEAEEQRETEDAARPRGPPIPYRKDTTGLSTGWKVSTTRASSKVTTTTEFESNALPTSCRKTPKKSTRFS
jgi:hypothetical protein